MSALTDPIAKKRSAFARWIVFGDELTARVFKTKLQGFLFLLLIFFASFIFESTPVNGIILCPFRAITGIECAGCGMTRAWVALAKGEVSLAVAFNPFGPLLLSLAVLKAFFLGVELKTRRKVLIPLWELSRTWLLGALATAMMAFGVYRVVMFFTV
ncbi:MAG: hypothetical protein AUK47_07060 [Deltaproteobacteria bacterium CG2_30_63_29]|nr:MAG: hypothetical protein AUK47_07060 [Deltaproteobacteria bacterium CG2_30_63_29]